MSILKRTALFEEHQKLKGKMVDFGGWELPVQYTGVLAEHTAVRTACGLFDVSHMGEIEVSGPGAQAFVNFVTTNDVSNLALQQAQYSAFCNEAGGIVDDLVVYHTAPEFYFLVVNASNTEKDFHHLERMLKKYSQRHTTIPKLMNRSAEYSQIAVQGPLSQKILQKLTSDDLSQIKTYWCRSGKVAHISALIARTGYTGEDGFEIYLPWNDAPQVWRALLEAGAPEGILPCGLGARDTLRLEMKYALYGHELTDETNPLEVGLGWITKLSKDEFVAQDKIQALKMRGVERALVGVKSMGRAIPRQGYEVYSSDQATKIGYITSGTSSPSLKVPIGIAWIQTEFAKTGTKLWVKVRDQLEAVEVVPTPFYKKG